MKRNRHRSDRPFRRAKALMHANLGYICHICGHGGAGEADHLVPVSVDPDQPVDWRNLRPSHGSNYPCRVCPRRNGKPRSCNQERGVKAVAEVFTPKMEW